MIDLTSPSQQCDDQTQRVGTVRMFGSWRSNKAVVFHYNGQSADRLQCRQTPMRFTQVDSSTRRILGKGATRTMRRITITGCSGYLGRKLADWFAEADEEIILHGIDVIAGRDPSPLDRFDQIDICSPDVLTALREFRPDTIIHTAFAFRQLHDTAEMRRVNIAGSQNILSCAAEVRPARLLLVSSATAYGAAADNPVPMDESWPIAKSSRFVYADDKMAVERLAEEFAAAEEGIHVSWVRPAIVAGPGMNNYLSRFILGMPFLLKLDGHDTPLQFVHEQDVLRAIHEILSQDGCGPFNIGPADSVAISQIASETKRRVFGIPLWVARAAHEFAWKLRIPIHESPASFLDFARYPWVVASSRLELELGFQFQYTGLETLRETIQYREKAKAR